MPTSLGQKKEDLIQLTELQGLQINLKIYLIKIDPNRETTEFAVEFSQKKLTIEISIQITS